MAINNSSLYKKIYGCLAGGAIGDAMGRPFEGKHYQDIEKSYGKVVGFIDGVHSCNVTDDTRMEHLLIKAIVEKKGRITVEDFANAWIKLPINPNDFFPDTRAALEKLRQGALPRRAGEGNIITGSGLMFVSPIGIINLCDPDQAVLDAREVASIQQPMLGVDCASVIAAAVAEAMKPEATVDSIIKCAIKVSSNMLIYSDRGYRFTKESIGGAIKKAVDVASKYDDIFEVRESLFKETLGYHAIDPVEVVSLTFAMIQVSGGEPKKAVIGGANIGRDSDTISRLGGSICGALKGIDAIPQDLLEKVEKVCIAEKTAAPYMDKPLAQVAAELTDAVKAHISQLETRLNQVGKLL